MEWAILQNVQISCSSDEVPYFVERMLSGYYMDEKIVAFQLGLINWKLETDYQVTCFRASDNGLLYENDSLRFIGRLKDLFPISLCFYYENSIVCIVRTLGQMSVTPDILTDFLKRNGLRGGISMQFHNFMHLEYAYIQCKQALQYSHKPGTSFLEIYKSSMIENINQVTSLKSLCHPTLLNYWEKGGEKKLEYIRCLQIFLQNGRNITEAALKLSIHRNTLIYRIVYMGNLLNLDLRAGYLENELLFVLLMSCNIIAHRFRQRNLICLPEI